MPDPVLNDVRYWAKRGTAPARFVIRSDAVLAQKASERAYERDRHAMNTREGIEPHLIEKKKIRLPAGAARVRVVGRVVGPSPQLVAAQDRIQELSDQNNGLQDENDDMRDELRRVKLALRAANERARLANN